MNPFMVHWWFQSEIERKVCRRIGFLNMARGGRGTRCSGSWVAGRDYAFVWWKCQCIYSHCFGWCCGFYSYKSNKTAGETTSHWEGASVCKQILDICNSHLQHISAQGNSWIPQPFELPAGFFLGEVGARLQDGKKVPKRWSLGQNNTKNKL